MIEDSWNHLDMKDSPEAAPVIAMTLPLTPDIVIPLRSQNDNLKVWEGLQFPEVVSTGFLR